MFKTQFLVYLMTFLLVSCGGGGGASGGDTGGSPSSSLFNPTLTLGFIQCQCGSCLAGVVATSTNPISAIGFSVDTTYAPAANSANWIPVNGATSISNNYSFTVPSPMNCTAYYNSEICSFAKAVDGQIAGGSCSTVRRIY